MVFDVSGIGRWRGLLVYDLFFMLNMDVVFVFFMIGRIFFFRVSLLSMDVFVVNYFIFDFIVYFFILFIIIDFKIL